MSRVALLLALLWTSLAAGTASAQAPPAQVAQKSSAGIVNLNDASEAQLSLLPGIGPAKAKAIVLRRRGHPFRRIDELTTVRGIGRKTLGKLRPYIAVAGATTLTTVLRA